MLSSMNHGSYLQRSKKPQVETLERRDLLTATQLIDAYPDVPDFGSSRDWSLNEINVPEVWAQGHTGEDVVVAVLDTGVDLDHPDLAENIWVNVDEVEGNGIDDDRNGYIDDVFGWDFVSNDAIPNDTNGHGTHVAGIIAAESNGVGSTGVAYSASIMPVQVLAAQGEGDMFDVAAGITYAVDNGADIINLSIGAERSSRRMRNAVLYAESNGVLIVAAAGNESESVPTYPAAYSSTFDNVISVGAYDRDLEIASFSNGVGTSFAVQVDAPGVAIYSTVENGRYANFSGTSMATPFVSGIAALAISADSTVLVEDLRTTIVATATQPIAGSDSAGGVNASMLVATFAPLEAELEPMDGQEEPIASHTAIFADVDGDGEVAFSDFLVLANNFGLPGEPMDGDIDSDGFVGFSDFLLISYNFGEAMNVAEVDAFFAQV